MSSAKAEIVIHAPLETVYDVITDFGAYPEFLNETKGVEILKSTPKSALVRFRITLIRRINYTLDIKMTPNKGLTRHRWGV